ncbi:phenylalanine--tRNA ligase subunit beta [Candidatus Woesearchaeota archaeon ex4484_78]|nr:MAG: phenylalanine--tRNA ligase subunit beta [Candidatus Woesearchaeota archaeon ex4484_78]
MPTISFSLSDLNKLLGKRLDKDKLEKLLPFAKAELEDVEGDDISVSFNDTNCPYLWSVEGLARLFKGVLNVSTGLYSIKVSKSGFKVVVDRKLSKIRPFISCFIAKGKKVDDYLLKQIIQLQEKLADSFGRRRKKVSIGVYPSKKIEFPVSYKAVSPSLRFVPLGCHEELSLAEILKVHPKGKEFAHILESFSEYPVLMDSKKNVLSFAPVINSELTGKLDVGDDELFFDATGTDEDSVYLVANIFAAALADRGFKIESLVMEYPSKRIVSPTLAVRRLKVNSDFVNRVVGSDFGERELKGLLERMRYGYSKGVVVIPFYRGDIMHPVDIAEDAAISFGYDNFGALSLSSYTVGKPLPEVHFIDSSRLLWVGLGYQEVLSAILSNKDLLYDKLNVSDFGTVEIENVMSHTYSCVRSWLLPVLLDVLSKNRHVDYPQRVFEEGLVSVRKGDSVVDERHLSAVSAHASASFTEIKQAVGFVLAALGVDFVVEEFEMGCFVPGRAAKIVVGKKQVGFFGEVHPSVLENFGLLVPVVGCEINLSLVLEYKSKK